MPYHWARSNCGPSLHGNWSRPLVFRQLLLPSGGVLSSRYLPVINLGLTLSLSRKNGRNGGLCSRDLTAPSRARYQTALHSEVRVTAPGSLYVFATPSLLRHPITGAQQELSKRANSQVGIARFERATFRSQSGRSNQAELIPEITFPSIALI